MNFDFGIAHPNIKGMRYMAGSWRMGNELEDLFWNELEDLFCENHGKHSGVEHEIWKTNPYSKHKTSRIVGFEKFSTFRIFWKIQEFVKNEDH